MKKIEDRTISLFYRWVYRRERKMNGHSLWLEAGPSSICCTTEPEPDDVDVMGEAFFALEEWKEVVLWVWATTEATQKGLDTWMVFQKLVGLSEKKFHSILLDLQDEAEKRGLLS